MTLIDTSVWVDFLNGHAGPHVVTLELLTAEEDICLCGVVLTEILQGIRSEKEYRMVKRRLLALPILSMRDETFVAAAEIYRLLRTKGFTVRKPIDCIIAAVAIEHNAQLLQNDRDFIGIAKHCDLVLTPYRA